MPDQETQQPWLTPDMLADIQEMTGNRWKPSEIRLILESVPTEASQVNFIAYLKYCHDLELNPLTNEVHLEFRKSKDVLRAINVVHVDAYYRAAQKLKLLDGIDHIPGTDEDGYYVDCILDLKGLKNPVKARAYYNEYKGTTDIWKNRKFGMTSKCSSSLAFRKAGILLGTLSEDEARSIPNDDDVPTPNGGSALTARPNGTAPGPDPFAVNEVKPTAAPTTVNNVVSISPDKEAAPTTMATAVKMTVETTDGVVTAVETQPIQPVEVPQGDGSEKPVQPKPKLRDRYTLIAETIGVTPKEVEPLIASIAMGFNNVERGDDLPKGKESAPIYHDMLDKLQFNLDSDVGVMVQQYIKDQPTVLGQFLAGRMPALPLLPGFMPPKRKATQESFMVMYNQHGWTDLLCAAAANYCNLRGIDQDDLTKELDAVKLKPKRLESIAAYLKLGMVTDSGYLVLEHAKKIATEQMKASGIALPEERKTKGPELANTNVGLLLSWIETQLGGRSVLNASKDEVDALIAQLPDTW